MFTFVYQPKANRETLREFNARVAEFCADNPVVNIDAIGFGDNLILQGTTADDMDVDNVPTLTAVIRTLDPTDTDLEEQLDGLIEQEKLKHHADPEEGDPNLPVRFLVVNTDKRSWVALICVNGVAEDEEPGEGGEGGEAPADPSSGFKG